MPHNSPSDAETGPDFTAVARNQPLDPDATLPPAEPAGETATLHPEPTTTRRLNTPNLPGFAIEGELGRGGMGVVYRARQLSLNRPVALKMVLGGAHADSRELARFLAEAEAVAAVRHEHVVQVFEFGEHEGRPYFAMEYLDGGSLSGLIKEQRRLRPEHASELVSQCARGVQAAHDLGIVHRDLKPANILLDGDGVPKVTDFGLAKRGGGSDLTRTGAVMGTPAYMAPEQARGETKFVGPGADVYALGVILFECLAGRPPFRGDDPVALIMQVATEEAPLVQKFAPEVHKDLSLICAKCLAKEARDRYPSAASLADDLDRFLSGEPVTVRPAGQLERAVKWAKRKPTLAIAYALTVAAIVLIGLVSGSMWLWQRAEGAREVAEIQRAQSEAAEAKALAARSDAEVARDQVAAEKKATEQARDELASAQKKLVRIEYARSADLAHREWDANNLSRARELLQDCQADLRGWEWRYVHRLCHADLRTVRGPFNGSRPIASSSDGTRILSSALSGGAVWLWEEIRGTWRKLPGIWGDAIAAEFNPDCSRVVVIGQDGTVRVCDLGPKPRPILLAAKDKIHRATFAPDGKRFVTTGLNGPAYTWEASTGAMLRTFDHGKGQGVHTAAFTADANRLTTIDDGGGIRVWNATSGEVAISLPSHSANVNFASVSRDGQWVATRTRQGDTQLRQVKAGATPVTIGQPPRQGEAAYFSPDGSQMATSNQEGVVIVWSTQDATRIVALPPQRQSQLIGFSPDGTSILTTGEDGVARIWDARTGVERLALKGHVGQIRAQFTSDGSRVITMGSDETARLWDAKSGPRSFVLQGDRRAKRAVFSPDGTRLAIPDTDDNLRVRDLATGKEVLLKGHSYVIHGIAFSRDGKRVATASLDGTARIWDSHSGKSEHTLEGHTGSLSAIAYSPDGTLVATGGLDKTVRLWKTDTGTELAILRDPLFGVASVSFSPDGKKLLVGGNGGVAVIWDVQTRTRIRNLATDSVQLHSAAYSPDGKQVVTSGDSGTAQVWNADSGEFVLNFRGHQDRVHSASFSPDGSRLVTAADDGTVKLWDKQSGVEVLTLKGHRGWVYDASFDSTGTRIVSCGDDGTVRVWDASPLNSDFFPRVLGPLPRLVASPEPAAKPVGPKHSPAKSGLVGEWTAVSISSGGMTVMVPEGLMTVEFTEEGKVLTSRGKGQPPDIGGFTIDPTKAPAQIDMHPPAETQDPPLLGIYKLDGDTLTLCYSKEHGAERPDRFESPKGSKVGVATWKRVKKK